MGGRSLITPERKYFVRNTCVVVPVWFALLVKFALKFFLTLNCGVLTDAPARTVSVMEDAREYVMTRYGGDVEMNLNLFLRPEDAREELGLKIGAQRRELERTLIEHGYSVLMEEGTNIVDAIIRSNPTFSTQTNSATKDVIMAAERINITSVFGAMSRNMFPVQNLLAAAKYASSYSTSNDRGSVLLLPHGSPDILRHTRRENMVYSITGEELLQRNHGKPIDMEVSNAYKDPSSNVSILIHRPMPSFESGVANPDVGMGPLTDIATFGVYYPVPKKDDGTTDAPFQITDFTNRCWHKAPACGSTSLPGDEEDVTIVGETKKEVLDNLSENIAAKRAAFEEQMKECEDNDGEDCDDDAGAGMLAALIAHTLAFAIVSHMPDDVKGQKDIDAFYKEGSAASSSSGKTTPILIRPKMEAVMSSAILAAPGSQTGELMIGYRKSLFKPCYNLKHCMPTINLAVCPSGQRRRLKKTRQRI